LAIEEEKKASIDSENYASPPLFFSKSQQSGADY